MILVSFPRTENLIKKVEMKKILASAKISKKSAKIIPRELRKKSFRKISLREEKQNIRIPGLNLSKLSLLLFEQSVYFLFVIKKVILNHLTGNHHMLLLASVASA